MDTGWAVTLGIVALVFSFVMGIGFHSELGSETTQLDHYCKSQDIQLEYNDTIQATEDGLMVECVDGGEARDFLLTEEEPPAPTVTIHPPKDDSGAEDLELNVTTESGVENWYYEN